MPRLRTYFGFFIVLFFVISWIIFVLISGSEELVAMVGMKNSYYLVFFVALLGGASTLTTASLYTTVVTLAIGGLDPLLLGFVSGVGAMLGDSVFYLLGFQGRQALSEKNTAKIRRFGNWLGSREHGYTVPIVIYTYTGFTPLPNDVLMGALGLAHYPYRISGPILLIGNITRLTLIAYLAISGIVFFGN